MGNLLDIKHETETETELVVYPGGSSKTSNPSLVPSHESSLGLHNSSRSVYRPVNPDGTYFEASSLTLTTCFFMPHLAYLGALTSKRPTNLLLQIR